jgi:hypothetical protein
MLIFSEEKKKMVEPKLDTSMANGPYVRLSKILPCAIGNKCGKVGVP